MKAKEMLEAGLMLGGLVLGAVGAARIAPTIIWLGAASMGGAAAMRFTDRRSAANRIANGAAGAGK